MMGPKDIPLQLASQLYGELQGLLSDHGMDVFVIGAFAAQLWVDDKGAAPYRGTRDVDIVIGVPSYPDYASVRDELVREWDRVKSLEGRHRLILDDGMKIDLLPLDAYAIQRSGMDFTELWSGPREFVGFAQVAKRGTTAYTVDDQPIRSATIPAIVGLKLISLDDRPIHRQKDAHDIGEIVLRYRDLENDNVWDHHYDLSGEGTDWYDQIYMALGREIQHVFAPNRALVERLDGIIVRLSTGELFGTVKFATGFISEQDAAVHALGQLLVGFRQNWTRPG